VNGEKRKFLYFFFLEAGIMERSVITLGMHGGF
jgi:hypothetical protein